MCASTNREIGERTGAAAGFLRASCERHAAIVATQLRLQKVVGSVVVLFVEFGFAAVPRAAAAP